MVPLEIEPFPIRTLIELCKLIKPGYPACYLLPTEKNEVDGNSAVGRWTFGERDESKSTKTILIVGETGTGKTTLINTMVNFMLGVGWEDRVWFQITEDKKKSQAKSQTSTITVYELFLKTSSSCLRIIDTPGYGDTDGIEFDQQIAENLHVLFRSEDGIHEIEAVGLVVKASQNRLTDFQRYIFDAVLSLFGKDIERNIVMFITHSDGGPAPNVINALNEAEVPCAKDTGGEPVHFMFNNRQTETYGDDFGDLYQGFWNLGYKSVEKFFSSLEGFERTELKMTEGVLRERKRLEACVHNLQDAIKMEELKQNELKQTQSALEENRKKFGNNENFTYEVDEPYKARVPIQSSWWHLTQQAMCCTICEENCHYPGCWWVKDLSWCSVMRDNKCTVCTGKCPVSAHVKQNVIYVPKTRKVTKTAVDLKQRYEKQVDIKKALEEELDTTKVKISELLEEAYQCIMKLEKIALKKDAFSTLLHLDFLIEKMRATGDDGKAQTLEKLSKQIEASHKKGGSSWRASLASTFSAFVHGHKLMEATGEVEQNVCQHRDLEFFCKTDQFTICAVCLAKEHNGHDIIPNKTNQTSSQVPEKMDPECSIRKGKEQLASTRSCNRYPFEREPFPISKLIEQSQPLKPGIPACYLLPTEKSKVDGNSAVRRWTFGKRDESKSTKIILIVGETGTGKTTLINTMVNFMLGVEWEDRVWFQITEDKKKSHEESQTSATTVYELFLETSSSCLRIIDTPGYGNTNGFKLDQQIAENLHVLFRSEDGIHEIEAVGLVVKASQNRLTNFQRYIFDAVLSLFGKDIERNIVMFITHSDGLPAANVINALNEAGVSCAKDSKGNPLTFLFDNRQYETYREDQEDICKLRWYLGYRSVEMFFSSLEGFERTDLKKTKGVLRERRTLEACVHYLQDAIKMEELKQNELQQTQRALEKNRKKEDFTYKVDEPYKAKVPINPLWWHLTTGAMCCTICEENCHYPGCWWVEDLSRCSVMKDGRCTVCTRKCPVSAHVKQNEIYVASTKTVKKTAVDFKQRYEEIVDIKKALEKELDNTKVEISKLLEKAYQCIMELEKIALKKDAFSTHVHLDFLIKKMKETGDDEKAQMLEKLSKQIKASHKWMVELEGWY